MQGNSAASLVPVAIDAGGEVMAFLSIVVLDQHLVRDLSQMGIGLDVRPRRRQFSVVSLPAVALL